MRYLLDTNILSKVTRPTPSQALTDWFADQIDTDLFISSLSLAEIHQGILEKPVGRKRRELEEWFGSAEGPQQLFRGRILGFEERAALVWGRQVAEGTRTGRPRSAPGMQIAAVAQVNDCLLVTDNEKHFAGIRIFNPLRR
jgi:predicted nucleic acid-binding protein